MAFFDLALEELQTYLPERNEQRDFDDFWRRTLEETRAYPLDAEFEPIDFGLHTVETFDVTFNGYAGQPIKAWLLLPKQRKEPLPCVIEYIGYGNGRGFPHDWLQFSAIGYAHLIMDTRGQGSNGLNGDTADIAPDGDNPQYPGFMTRGVLSPESYYYRRVFADAVRAVEVAQDHPVIARNRIVVTGRSQGGGIAIAVAGLVDDLSAVMPDVPFLCHYQRATAITDAAPYSEIREYLRRHRGKSAQVFDTLSYFDGINFAKRASAAALFSVGLMDMICPPSTVYAAFNHYNSEKTMAVYDYNDHEGGGTHHLIRQIAFLQEIFRDN
jgi:cephalosporin-C deacetylase